MVNLLPNAQLIVIGGGIVGLATAWRYSQRFPDRPVVVLEKEPAVAMHQTGRNSGVIHSGIYYKPGSLKAQTCRDGKQQLEQFCTQNGVPFETCGKVIVATDPSQVAALEKIQERGVANGVPSERIGPERLAELEPHAAGVAALHVPSTGIVDYAKVCYRLVDQIQQQGGRVVTGAKVTAIALGAGEVVVHSTAGEFTAPRVVNCAGLFSDQVAKLSGLRPAARIIPFRGEYFDLAPQAHHLVKNLIYPTPDPSFPFLGVHFTRMIGGGVECGPNAVLALAREGYGKTSVNLRELVGSLSFGGFQRLALRHWRMGAGEMWRSLSKGAFVRALSRLVPEIRSEHLTPAEPGIRAQAVLPNGELVDDFLIESSGPVVNVLNAPSPAATASLEIGRQVVERLAAE
ncbi:L-2-hydroxyglutarate oxidase LhgO [Pirellulimonas nuda]|uniref:L-2-hydroxyglutarate oxidase LhgO n=1 Tax=Pirellulimonas nuda TaxID=2528009 RepID=A0A518DIF2_9BACT|nr:L-2-hydroxyglutarate oxidase [Pirellulimonas nuda]QDU91254.1 L-2-hydroxyglutarate oxidase LhgO [Pirellulimonas nuda]